MPKKIIAKKTWRKKRYLQMGTYAKNNATKMTGNANFLLPVPPVAVGAMTIAGQLVIDLYPNRNDSLANKDAFKSAVDDCDDKLHLQIDYVSEQSGGDATKIISAGCIPSTNAVTVAVRLGNTPTPAFKALGGGRMKSKVAKVPGATSYMRIFFDDPESILNVDVDTISCVSANGGSFFFCDGKLTREMGGFTANKKIYGACVCKNNMGYGNLSAITSSGVL